MIAMTTRQMRIARKARRIQKLKRKMSEQKWAKTRTKAKRRRKQRICGEVHLKVYVLLLAARERER